MSKIDNNTVFRVVLIVLAAFVLFALISYYNSKQNQKSSERFFTGTGTGSPPQINMPSMNDNRKYSPPSYNTGHEQKFEGYQEAPKASVHDSGVAASDIKNEDYRAVDYQTEKIPSDCFPKDRLTSQDLLPKDAANSTWSQVATNGQGDLGTQNFLTAGYHVGISTISGSLRNANLQIRSEPPNPVVEGLSPWMNSTITASDLLRKPLEIGSDC